MPFSYLYQTEKGIKHNKLLDLVCFSHLRWDYVYHRPQHLLTRFAAKFRVFFVEEPIMYKGTDKFEVTITKSNVWRVIPMLSSRKVKKSLAERQTLLLNSLFSIFEIKEYIFWYYSPLAISFTKQFSPLKIIYDCNEEFSVNKLAPATVSELESELLQKSDIVFASGINLFNVKKKCNSNIHLIPGSLDKEHFFKARKQLIEPPDQCGIPHPRIGYFGVIDERFDSKLLKSVADSRPDWHFVLIGPVVNIKMEDLPKNINIHYLGGKSYDMLPKYLSRWDVAMIPFEDNLHTKFTNPAKTPEYLAGGKPVISTLITDVVKQYGDNKLVWIVNTPFQFINGVEHELHGKNKKEWLKNVDAYLATTSWDKTFSQMLDLIIKEFERKKEVYDTPALQNNNHALVTSNWYKASSRSERVD